MGEVTLTPTRAHDFIAGTLQSPALAPPLPAKERTVRDGEGSSSQEEVSTGTEGEKRMRRYTKTIQVEKPNTSQVHRVIPDGH